MMFSDRVWAMIHNRFKESTRVIPWNENMDAADWWIANDMGDPYAEDVNIIAAKPMPDGMMGFFERLHHAYNSTMGFWDDKDEKGWYEEWILPFDDPLKHNHENDLGGAYDRHPMDYFGNIRNYFENEAPSEIFQHENFNKVAETFAWRPLTPAKEMFFAAINKSVI